MKNTIFCLIFLFVFAACDRPVLKGDNEIDNPRIIAVKVTGPIFAPEDKIEMSALLGAADETLLKDSSVEWLLGNVLVNSPYGKSAAITIPDEENLATMFTKEEADAYVAKGYFDTAIKVKALAADGSFTLLAEKNVRLTRKDNLNDMGYDNPVIESIKVSIDGTDGTPLVNNGNIVLKGDLPKKLSFTAVMKEDGEIVTKDYDWYVSGLFIKRLADHSQSEISLNAASTGVFSVYLVVKDLTVSAVQGEHHGCDFFTFRIYLNTDAPVETADSDNIAADEDILTTDA